MIQSNFNLLLAVSGSTMYIVFAILLLVGLGSGLLISNFTSVKKTDRAQKSASKIIEDAYSEVKTIKKESILETKEDIHKLKVEADREIQSRRLEIQKIENRIEQKDEQITSKLDKLFDKEKQIEEDKGKYEEKKEKLEKSITDLEVEKNKISEELEKVAQFTKQEAKDLLISKYEKEARVDASKSVKEIIEIAQDEAVKKSKNILTLAIQKSAVDHTSEITVTSVSLPNDEIKGRIIGREGRNIRALEKVTGVDLIVDDTPETVVLSGFDPIRREIARLSLEKLIQDGRIHPTSIEDTVEKVKRDLDETIKEAGEEAVFEAGLHGINSEIIKLLGKLKYRTSYGQNILKHSLECAHLASAIASEVGANAKVAKRGALLHDLGKALDFEMEGTHVEIGVRVAKKYGENKDITHCIEAHHGDVEFASIEAIIVQIADAISSARPGARRESLENYIQRLKDLEEIANGFDGVDQAYAIQAGREIRIIVSPDKVTDNNALFLSKDIAKKIEEDLDYPGNIKVNVIRESRKVSYAK